MHTEGIWGYPNQAFAMTFRGDTMIDEKKLQQFLGKMMVDLLALR